MAAYTHTALVPMKIGASVSIQQAFESRPVVPLRIGAGLLRDNIRVEAPIRLGASVEICVGVIAPLRIGASITVERGWVHKPSAGMRLGAAIEAYHGQAALDGWGLFVATGGAAFDWDNPDEVFAATPYNTTLTLATGTHQVAVRKRDRYGQWSANIDYKMVVVDAVGGETSPPPSPPDSVTMEQIAGNKARMTAVYYPKRDGALAAMHWVYTIDDGGGFPAVIVAAMRTGGGGQRVLIVDSGPHGDATTVTGTVWTRRTVTPDDFDSTTVIDSVLISTGEPNQPAGGSAQYYQESLI